MGGGYTVARTPGLGYARIGQDMDSTRSDLVPRRTTLDGFGRDVDSTEGLNVRAAEPLVPILVTTKNSVYRIIPLRRGDAAVLVQGGRFFPEPAEVRLIGSTFGGSLIKLHCIRVGMQMEIQAEDGRITTTRVLDVSLEAEPAEGHRSH